MVSQAMSSYLALCGDELVNAARLSAYVAHGLKPATFTVNCAGCPGLEDILPCIDSAPPDPATGYTLPEIDDAPWYDKNVAESRNFAGLLVTEVTMSSPYKRTLTDNVGDGQTLGRLKRTGREIVVTGWLIGKTCCATGYGWNWLTEALSGNPCTGDCGGCNLDFLACCPSEAEETEGGCITLLDAEGNPNIYVRPALCPNTDPVAPYERVDTETAVGLGGGPGDTIPIAPQFAGRCGRSSYSTIAFTNTGTTSMQWIPVILNRNGAVVNIGQSASVVTTPAGATGRGTITYTDTPGSPTDAYQIGIRFLTAGQTGPVEGRHFLAPLSTDSSEYERAETYFRRMQGAGVISGPDVLEQRGTGCGCGSGQLIKVSFVLATSSPYAYTLEQEILQRTVRPDCTGKTGNNGLCGVTWVSDIRATTSQGEVVFGRCDQIGVTGRCDENPECLDDPDCPRPALPPSARQLPLSDCGCAPVGGGERVCVSQSSSRDWGSSTLNFEVFAGSSDLRNFAIRLFENPLGLDCGMEDDFPACAACSTLLVSYVPAGGTLRFSGEERKVTITCNGVESNGFRNVTNIDGQPFGWPDFSCKAICACAEWDCQNSAADSTVRIWRVDREL